MKWRGGVIASVVVLGGVHPVGAQSTANVQGPDRAALEQRLRERVAQVTRRRLGINDAQMAQLAGVNSRYAPEIGKVSEHERETRQQLRGQLNSSTPDEAEVGRLVDAMFKLQKQRISLLEAEQRDLAVFLSPAQRARYMGLQAQIRRRTEQLQREGDGAPGRRARNRRLR